MKIAFITAMWKRPAIFELFARGIINLQKGFPEVEIQCFVAGSEGVVSKSLAERFGFVYTEFANQPLNKKFNAAALSAKEWNPDYCIFVGSDDIIAPGCFENYLNAFGQGFRYVALNDCYFVSMGRGKLIWWPGYKDDRVCGLGRALNDEVMSGLHWQPYSTAPGLRTLETDMDLLLGGLSPLKIKHTAAFDLKSSVNINRFKMFKEAMYADSKEVLTECLGEEFANEILSFKE